MRRQNLLIVLLIVLSCVTFKPAGAIQAAPSAASSSFAYFSETGHNIGMRIKSFYDRNGGLPIFGLPLTELFEEDGRMVQYFERARFEMHPENSEAYMVQLTLLGRIFTESRLSEPPFQFGVTAPCQSDTCVYFPESTHTLANGFLAFWRKHGGLPTFGYPISEEFQEVNPTDGQTYTVQYTERARFEFHPEHIGTPWEVQVGHLGAEYARLRNLAPDLRAPVKAITLLGSATTGFNGSAAERSSNIARAAGRFNGMMARPGEIFSFLHNVGDISPEAGFEEGYAIIGGRLEKVVGGGVCQVSTTFYRAVFYAGLEFIERHPHSFVVYFYENIAGFDAAVFSPSLDFRWRNDTSSNVYITTETNIKAGTVTFSLWGVSDGRKSRMIGPTVSNTKEPSRPVWQYDRTLNRGEVRQLVHGRAGMDVMMERLVTAADGRQIRRDRIPTKYKPWEDFFIYGPGVTPPPGVTIAPPKK